MIKLDVKILLGLSLLLANFEPVLADLKQDSTVLINGGKALPHATSTRVDAPAVVDSFSFDKKTEGNAKKTLRCWQDGVMIVAEKGWNLAATQAPLLVNNKSQKAYAFNYSDTFCLYIGG